MSDRPLGCKEKQGDLTFQCFITSVPAPTSSADITGVIGVVICSSS
jgi:hypothetical protein